MVHTPKAKILKFIKGDKQDFVFLNLAETCSSQLRSIRHGKQKIVNKNIGNFVNLPDNTKTRDQGHSL